MQSLPNPCLEAFSSGKVKTVMGKCFLTPAFRNLNSEIKGFVSFIFICTVIVIIQVKFLIAKSDQALETVITDANYVQCVQQINKFCLYPVIFNVCFLFCLAAA